MFHSGTHTLSEKNYQQKQLHCNLSPPQLHEHFLLLLFFFLCFFSLLLTELFQLQHFNISFDFPIAHDKKSIKIKCVFLSNQLNCKKYPESKSSWGNTYGYGWYAILVTLAVNHDVNIMSAHQARHSSRERAFICTRFYRVENLVPMQFSRAIRNISKYVCVCVLMRRQIGTSHWQTGRLKTTSNALRDEC